MGLGKVLFELDGASRSCFCLGVSVQRPGIIVGGQNIESVGETGVGQSTARVDLQGLFEKLNAPADGRLGALVLVKPVFEVKIIGAALSFRALGQGARFVTELRG